MKSPCGYVNSPEGAEILPKNSSSIEVKDEIKNTSAIAVLAKLRSSVLVTSVRTTDTGGEPEGVASAIKNSSISKFNTVDAIFTLDCHDPSASLFKFTSARIT